jgi:hypothetical protein
MPEVAKNLVRMHWPNAPISAASVVKDWSNFNVSLGGLSYLEGYGFDGHHIAAYSPVSTRSQIIKAANTSGIYAVILGGAHAVAVIGADRRGIRFVTWGRVVFSTWAQWKSYAVTSMDADLSVYSQDDLDADVISHRINTMPRRIFQWASAKDRYNAPVVALTA